MAKVKQFSVILPTYSGMKTIAQTFDSLLIQDSLQTKYEVVVVIDGPAPALRETVEVYRKQFETKKIAFKIEQFKQNKGRFEARVAGAKLASHDQLLFLEDRVYLVPEYFKKLSQINYDLALGNVLEDKSNSNFIADSLTLIRRAVYGKQWGQSFKDYDINLANFEKAPKGMASLWVNKQVFLDACAEFKKNQSTTRDVSDDTGVLRLIVQRGNNIRRLSSLKLYYVPRTGLAESIKHLYQRGPKFVDYYLKPGTRFFYSLMVFYIALIVIIALAIFKPVWLWLVLAGYLLAILILMIRAAQNLGDVLALFAGLPLVIVIFFAGVLKGTTAKLLRGWQ